MQIFLAVTPDHLRDALGYTDHIAHMAYQVGPEGRLTRQNLLARTQGGLMLLGDRDCGPIRDVQALCRDVWRECAGRNFGGVAADFECPPQQDRTAFLEALCRIMRRNNKQLFVPEAYGRDVPQAGVLICTALSGGTLRARLEEAVRTYGQRRVALDLQRLRMAFPLPCPSGEGDYLTGEELGRLLEEKRPTVFYSADLCAKYFTVSAGNQSRFILFDDADTLRRKMQLGQNMGLGVGFLMYPEVPDLLPALFGKNK